MDHDHIWPRSQAPWGGHGSPKGAGRTTAKGKGDAAKEMPPPPPGAAVGFVKGKHGEFHQEDCWGEPVE